MEDHLSTNAKVDIFKAHAIDFCARRLIIIYDAHNWKIELAFQEKNKYRQFFNEFAATYFTWSSSVILILELLLLTYFTENISVSDQLEYYQFTYQTEWSGRWSFYLVYCWIYYDYI